MQSCLTVLCMSMVLLLTACQSPPSEISPEELQALQSREYPNSADTVFNSVVSVLHDLSYKIVTADRHAGLIQGEELAHSESQGSAFLGFGSPDEVILERTKISVFIESVAGNTRVRTTFVNFVQSTYRSGQQQIAEEQLLELPLYQDFFTRVDTAIGVRAGKNISADESGMSQTAEKEQQGI